MPAKGETPNPDALRKAGDEVRAKIVAAIPKQAYAAPKKRRKLLVIESLHGMSHNTIPHTNVMIEEMGKITGAWEAEFNNDLDNLKYPKIKEYDGVFLNSIVGELLRRSGRARGARAVREGRGRPWRHSRHAVGVAQLGRVRGDDRRAERAAPDRAGRDEGVRPGQPAHEAVRRQGSAVSRGVLPLRTRRPGAAAVGQRARPADRRARRPEDRAAPVERLQASRQHLSRSRGFVPTARDASSTTRSATCRRRS